MRRSIQPTIDCAANQLAEILASLDLCESSRTVRDQLVEFLREHELKLPDDQRLPLSTEILESCFDLFKQLERQHSKGGFTSLLASFGALLQPATPESVRTAFGQVSVKQMRAWVSNNLGTTVPSKRLRRIQNHNMNIHKPNPRKNIRTSHQGGASPPKTPESNSKPSTQYMTKHDK